MHSALSQKINDLLLELHNFKQAKKRMSLNFDMDIDAIRAELSAIPSDELNQEDIELINKFYKTIIVHFNDEIKNDNAFGKLKTSSKSSLYTAAYSFYEQREKLNKRLTGYITESGTYLSHPLNHGNADIQDLYVTSLDGLNARIKQAEQISQELKSTYSPFHEVPAAKPAAQSAMLPPKVDRPEQKISEHELKKDIVKKPAPLSPISTEQLLALCQQFVDHCDLEKIDVDESNYIQCAQRIVQDYVELSRRLRAQFKGTDIETNAFEILSQIYELLEEYEWHNTEKASGFYEDPHRGEKESQRIFEHFTAPLSKLYVNKRRVANLHDLATQLNSFLQLHLANEHQPAAAAAAAASTASTPPTDLDLLIAEIKSTHHQEFERIVVENPGIGFHTDKKAVSEEEDSFTPLMYAAKYSVKPGAIRALLNADISEGGIIRKGSVNQALRNTVRSSINPFNGFNIWMIAAHQGHHLILKELIELTPSPKARQELANQYVSARVDTRGFTPLLLACVAPYTTEAEQDNILKKIRLLLAPELGVDINAQSKAPPHSNALACAAATGNIAAMQLLLQHGAVIDVPGVNYEFALSLNKKGEANKNQIRNLLQKPASKAQADAAQAMAVDLTSESPSNEIDEKLTQLMNLIIKKSTEERELELVTLLSHSPHLLDQRYPKHLSDEAQSFGLTPVIAAMLYSSQKTLDALLSFIAPEKRANYINAIIEDRKNPFNGCSALFIVFMNSKTLKANLLLDQYQAQVIYTNQQAPTFNNKLMRVAREYASKITAAQLIPDLAAAAATATPAAATATPAAAAATPAAAAATPAAAAATPATAAATPAAAAATPAAAAAAPAAAAAASRAPRARIGLFHHAEGEHTIHAQATRVLSDHLAATGHVLGSAYSEGDCLFDSMVQGIESLGINIPHAQGSSAIESHKKLRLICDAAARDPQKSDAIRQLLASDARGRQYDYYLRNIQYTAPEMERRESQGLALVSDQTIWGRAEIDGVIICRELSISLHMIEVIAVAGQVALRHNLIDGTGSREIVDAEVNDLYQNPRTVHIAVYQNSLHFAPVTSRPVPKQEQPQSAPKGLLFELPANAEELTLEQLTTLANRCLQVSKNIKDDITQYPMQDPVILVETGKVFDREGLLLHFSSLQHKPAELRCPMREKIRDKAIVPCLVSRQLIAALESPLDALPDDGSNAEFPPVLTKEQFKAIIRPLSGSAPAYLIINRAAIKFPQVAAKEFYKSTITHPDAIKGICLAYKEITGTNAPGVTSSGPSSLPAPDQEMKPEGPGLLELLNNILDQCDGNVITQERLNTLEPQERAVLATKLLQFHQKIKAMLFRTNPQTNQLQVLSDPIRLADGQVQDRCTISETPEAYPSCQITTKLIGDYDYPKRTLEVPDDVKQVAKITSFQMNKIINRLGMTQNEFCIEVSRIRRASVQNPKLINEGTKNNENKNSKNINAIYTLCVSRGEKDYFNSVFNAPQTPRTPRANMGMAAAAAATPTTVTRPALTTSAQAMSDGEDDAHAVIDLTSPKATPRSLEPAAAAAAAAVPPQAQPRKRTRTPAPAAAAAAAPAPQERAQKRRRTRPARTTINIQALNISHASHPLSATDAALGAAPTMTLAPHLNLQSLSSFLIQMAASIPEHAQGTIMQRIQDLQNPYIGQHPTMGMLSPPPAEAVLEMSRSSSESEPPAALEPIHEEMSAPPQFSVPDSLVLNADDELLHPFPAAAAEPEHTHPAARPSSPLNGLGFFGSALRGDALQPMLDDQDPPMSPVSPLVKDESADSFFNFDKM